MPKGTLNKIAAEKRERVLLSAATLFAERGFAHTDMAQLASRAKVAKGSLYNYFESKEELYDYVCRYGLELSRSAVYSELDESWDIYQQVEKIFRQGVRFAQEHPEFVALYLNISSAGMDNFADQLSREVEKHTADHLKRIIRQGQEAGAVRADLDVNLVAFQINNTYIMLLASLVSRHFKIRLSEYLELDEDPSAEEIERYLERTIELIHGMLRPATSAAHG